MPIIPPANGDTNWCVKSTLQNSNILKERDENLNKINTNDHKQWQLLPKTNHSRKGPTSSFSDTGLVEGGISAALQSLEGSQKLRLYQGVISSDKLELNLPEPGKNLPLSVTPIKIVINRENLRNTYFELVQHEVNHLREKFELNNRNYQMDDLIRLTDTSKKILNYGVTEKYTDCDHDGRSIFYNQECRRVEIERKVGLCLFLKVYEKMISIINDDFDSNLRHSLERKSRNLKALNTAGDNDDSVRNKWKQIVRILNDKQEYLPDIWELAMSEYMFYHI